MSLIADHTALNNGIAHATPKQHAKVSINFAIKTLESVRDTAGPAARTVINKKLINLYAERQAIL